MSQEICDNNSSPERQELLTTQTKKFLRAAHDGDLEAVEGMLRQGVPADVANAAGLQGIHFASKAGNLELIQLFLNNGVSVNAQSLKGNSPLHAAALIGDSEVVKLLLNRGAKVNITCECNEEVFSPLYMAAQIGHQEIVTLLLAHGADPSLKTSNGFTARDIASQQGHSVITEILDEYSNRLNKSKKDAADHDDPPSGEQSGDERRPSRTCERLDLNLLKRMEKELIGRGHQLRAPAIARRDICPSPRASPMRRNFESQCSK